MNWKKRIAKEWIWFLCMVAVVLLFWSVVTSLEPKQKLDWFLYSLVWARGIRYENALFITVMSIAILYVVRFTAWSIKQFIKK
jgi:hypothetical protein